MAPFTAVVSLVIACVSAYLAAYWYSDYRDMERKMDAWRNRYYRMDRERNCHAVRVSVLRKRLLKVIGIAKRHREYTETLKYQTREFAVRAGVLRECSACRHCFLPGDGIDIDDDHQDVWCSEKCRDEVPF